jgi:hypothetical protein
VHDIEFAAQGTLFLGTLHGVWKSEDDGTSFQQLALGIGADDQVLEITTDPADFLRLWVGVADAEGAQLKNLLVTDDGGQTWSDRTPAGAAGKGCTAVTLDPADANRVWASFSSAFGGGSSVWSSEDGGLTWADRTGNLPTAAPFTDLAHDGSRILVSGGQLFEGQSLGLYSSTDGGLTWVAVHDASWPSQVVTDIEVHPFQAGNLQLATIGGGVFRSIDGGASWTFGVGGTDGMHLHEVSVDPITPADVYTGGSTVAVWKSVNSGLDFASSSTGIRALHTAAILTHGVAGGELAMCFNGLNTGGIYTSEDGGVSWELEPAPATRWNEVEFAPSGLLFATSAGPVSIAQEGVYLRTVSGWNSIGPDTGPLFETNLVNLEVGKTTQDILAVGNDFGTAGSEAIVWRRPKPSGIWAKVYEGTEPGEQATEAFYFDHGGDKNVCVGVRDLGPNQTGRILRSTNFGQSFGTVGGVPASAQFTSFTFSPTNAKWAFVANEDPSTGGVYFSDDEGVTWSLQPGTGGPVHRLVGDPLRPGELYALRRTETPKVENTLDYGVTFMAYDEGLDPLLAIEDAVYWEGVNSEQFEQCDYLMIATSGGLWQRNIHCALDSDVDSISLGAGGVQNFVYSLGPKHAFELYVLLGTFSGTSPGIPIDDKVLPLNLDDYLTYTASSPGFAPLVGGFGQFDATGMATAQFVAPAGLYPASLVGFTLHHAYLAIDVSGMPYVSLISNACPLELTP